MIHAGDACDFGNKEQLEYFFEWYQKQPAQYKIFVSGNHDTNFETANSSLEKMMPQDIVYLEVHFVVCVVFMLKSIKTTMLSIVLFSIFAKHIEKLIKYKVAMRIHLRTTPNSEVVSFEYQRKLVGTLHKWLGSDNDEHGNLSLYSFSWLQNGEKNGDGLTFAEGAHWFISFYDESRIKQIIRSIMNDPEMFSGMRVSNIIIEETPDLSRKSLFYLGSPIFIKKLDEKNWKAKQLTFEDEESNYVMTQTLLHKMRNAGLPVDETLSIRFDLGYTKRKTKLLTYRGVGNRTSMCPILIDGKPETKAFAWNVGIGNSTGIGFGSIY